MVHAKLDNRDIKFFILHKQELPTGILRTPALVVWLVNSNMCTPIQDVKCQDFRIAKGMAFVQEGRGPLPVRVEQRPME